MTNIIAIIPSRSGSKSIKNKNLQKINGKTLLQRSIEFALSLKYVSKVVVSTDSSYYKKLAIKYGADCPFLRPKKLANDFSHDIDVFYHCLNWLKINENYNSDIVINLRPTYPFRKKKDFEFAINRILKNPSIDSVKSVCKIPFPLDKAWTLGKNKFLKNAIHKKPKKEFWNLPRQQLENYYVQNGNIDIIRSGLIFKKLMSGEKIYPIIQNHFFDIDSYKDIKQARKFKNF